jgi:hypothetical protein
VLGPDPLLPRPLANRAINLTFSLLLIASVAIALLFLNGMERGLVTLLALDAIAKRLARASRPRFMTPSPAERLNDKPLRRHHIRETTIVSGGRRSEHRIE